jgi:hypothetical protein
MRRLVKERGVRVVAGYSLVQRRQTRERRRRRLQEKKNLKKKNDKLKTLFE